MCIPSPTIKNNTTTTSPAPPQGATAQSAAAAQGDIARPEEAKDTENLRAKRRGRAGLRIRLDAGNTGGPTGLNVPRA